MKNIILAILILSCKTFSQEFWEPAQLSLQANTYSLFGYFSHETKISRKVHSQGFQNISMAMKLDQFELNVGVISSNMQKDYTYNYGLTFYYRGESNQNSPFLKYSRSYNWIKDISGDVATYTYSDGSKSSFYSDTTSRDMGIFEVGYNFNTNHNFNIRCSIGFIQGIGSSATLVAPMPILQMGITYRLWKSNTVEQLIFY